MHYLLIGGAGYIGSHVAEELHKKNEKVIIYDNLSTGFKEFVDSKSKFYKGDILNKARLKKVFDENQIDVVIYLAGLIKVGESVQFPLKYYKTNIQGLINVLELMDEHKVNNLVFSSSAAVYGNESNKGGYFTETDDKKPISPYGKTKAYGEEIIKDYAQTNKNFHYTFLRYFNVAGASLSRKIGYLTKNNLQPTHLLPAISYYAFGLLKNFKIYGNDYKTDDFTCVRDYVYVSELAYLHILSAEFMLKNKQNKIYNIGSSKGFSNLEIFKAFEKNLNKDLNLEYGPRRSGDPDILIADSELIQKELNYQIHTSLDDIVKNEIEFRKTHLNGFKNKSKIK